MDDKFIHFTDLVFNGSLLIKILLNYVLEVDRRHPLEYKCSYRFDTVWCILCRSKHTNSGSFQFFYQVDFLDRPVGAVQFIERGRAENCNFECNFI